jgi:hypothetical protein
MGKRERSSRMNRDYLHRQLIKLGDMMGDGLHHEEPWIAKEYTKIAKILYPEMYPRKQRKPTQSAIRTLRQCDCGNKGWTFERHPPDGVRFSCKQCSRKSEICKTNTLARDSWNNTFTPKLL